MGDGLNNLTTSQVPKKTDRATLERSRCKVVKSVPSRQRGVALIIVAVTLAILGAIVSDFAYNARVDLEAAANARDQLRAEYLARAGIQLSRLLIKVQQSVLDAHRKELGDIQISEFSPYLLRAFGGPDDERQGLAGMFGVDVTQMKGMGVGKEASFDVEMSSDDGRLNLNCGGGLNDGARQQGMYKILDALFWPPRYNRLFGPLDAEGHAIDRDDNTRDDNARLDVTRALLDWADVDESRFQPVIPGTTPNTSSAGEDYRYDSGRDAYKARNNFYDSAEEVKLVRGAVDEFWGSFGSMFTVYGSCKVNVTAIIPDNWPLMAAIIRASAKDDAQNNPQLLDDNTVAALSQQIMGMAKIFPMNTQEEFVQWVTDPEGALKKVLGLPGNSQLPIQLPPGMAGIPLDAGKLGQLIKVGPRRTYRLESTGTVQRGREKKVQVRVRAIWDTQHTNQNTQSSDPNDRQGTWLYWRED